MESMSHGAEIFGLGGEAAAEPSFEQALRGYDKKQVERYVARAENEIAALSQEREQAYSQMQAMARQIDQLQQETVNARRQPPAGPENPVRDLGPNVGADFPLVEQQAEAIKASATDDIAARLAEAERIRAEAEAHAHDGIRDFEIAL